MFLSTKILNSHRVGSSYKLQQQQQLSCSHNDVDGSDVLDGDVNEEDDNLDEKDVKGKLTQSCFELRVAHTRRLASPLGSHTRSHPPG